MNLGLVLLSPCLALTVVVSMPSQACVYYPSNTPTTGSPNTRPFGNTNPSDPVFSDLRYQIQVPASVLGNQPLEIREVFAVPAGSRRRQFTQLTVRFGHNPTTLGAQMNSNIVGPSATLVENHWIERDSVANQWMPLGMRAPFQYVPSAGELVIEFRVVGGGGPTGTGTPGFRTDSAIPYVHALGASWNGTYVTGGGIKLRLCTEHHGFIDYGGGCTGSNGLTPRLGFSGSAQIGGGGFAIALSDALAAPDVIAGLLLDFSAPGAPLDLGGLGAMGCRLFVYPDVTVPVVTSTGAASIVVRLPVGMSPSTPVWMQWFFVDLQANALGVVGSNFGMVTIGP